MEVQRWILRNVLTMPNIHPSSFAYQANHSITQCASIHLGARWLVKMDLHDFFDNIDEVRVYNVFRQLDYSPLVSLELARICTRLPLADSEHRTRARSYTSIPFYATDAQGWLPQGAPTSGALANAVAFPLDQKLSLIATRRSMAYTRYSDDLTFSGITSFNRGQATSLIDQVCNVVRDERFSVHRKKTRIVPPGARHIVLGLMLGPDRLRLLPDFKRRINVHIRGVDLFGLAQHSAHRGFRSIFSFVNHMDGCLAFAQGIELAYAQDARERWNRALAKSGFPIDES
jgi:RNA-directed DNA polymerase